jgi:agmatinase
MSNPLTEFPGPGFTSFLGSPTCQDVTRLEADFAILGMPFGSPYHMQGVASGASEAPAAIRERSARFGRMMGNHDFDLGGEIKAGRDVSIVDCGNVASDPRDLEGNKTRATESVRTILERGAVPFVLGGDDSIPALVLRAYEGRGPLHVLQIDAHLDYRDDVDGVRDGYSSPMRRAAEMPWVERIVHVGARGVGSARPGDVEDTLAAGNTIITAKMVREHGIGRVLDEFPEGANYFITLDCDGFDPAVMPGTSCPMPGGLTFDDGSDLLQGLVGRGTVVGMDCAEHFPCFDVNGITSLALGRLIVTLIGTMIRKE